MMLASSAQWFAQRFDRLYPDENEPFCCITQTEQRLLTYGELLSFGGLFLYYVLLPGKASHYLIVFLLQWLVCYVVVWLALVDYHIRVLPDVGILLLLIVGLALNFASSLPLAFWQQHVAIAVIFLIVGYLASHFFDFGLGLGDIKLIGVCAIFLTWPQFFFVLFIGSLAGMIFGYVTREVGQSFQSIKVPMGPGLAFAFCCGAVLQSIFSI